MSRILGLDIGISSVGWSLVDSELEEIIDLGVRIFSSADAEKNQERREARSSRRTLRRKKLRLEDTKKLLNDNNFSDLGIDYNPYELRCKGLEKKLKRDELFVALYHLIKRRGISYLEDADLEDANNAAEGIKENIYELRKKYPCEIQLDRFKKYGKVRGIIELEDKSLINIFPNQAYKKEALKILETQKKYYEEIDKNFVDEYINILTRKRKFYHGPGNEKSRTNYGIYKEDGRTISSIFDELIGNCSIYEDEKRASMSSFTAEEFNLLNDLNNLTVGGKKLTKDEKEKIVEEILSVNTKSCTGKKVLNIIKKVTGIDDILHIKGYRIDSKGKAEFTTFECDRALRRFIEKNQEDLSFSYDNLSLETKDKLSEVFNLSYDKELMIELINSNFNSFNEKDIDLLYKYLQENKSKYGKWHSFSLKLMREMRDSLYNESKNQMVILTDRGLKKSISNKLEGYKYIPESLFDDEIYNPVVKKSIREAIKLINAVMKKYGEINAIVVEMPRETNPKEKKQNINKFINKNKKEKEEAFKKFNNEYGKKISEDYALVNNLFDKIRFWYQQDGKCIYSNKPIQAHDLINNPNNFEIDHIIPKSVSLDDSINNKVIVYSELNQLKGNKTPFMAFNNSKKYNYENIKLLADDLLKKGRISKNKYDLLTFEEDINKYDTRKYFINRNLVDTRYSSRAILNGLSEYVKYKGLDTEIHTVTGKFTSTIRKRWGLNKDREESYKHHAIDGTIVAISFISGLSNDTIINPKWTKRPDNKSFDKQVFSEPWPGFVDELKIIKDVRTIEDVKAVRNNKLRIKYSTKKDSKVNRKLSDLQPVSTRKIGKDYFQVKSFNNIYDNNVAKKLIKKIEKDMNKNDTNNSEILMRKHDPKTFKIILNIIEEYKDEEDNPFEAYRKEHGYIKKYSKKGNGPAIKNIKYLGYRAKRGIEIKTESKDRKVFLLNLVPFRSDVYYNKEKDSYKLLPLLQSDLRFKDGNYVIDEYKYENLKNKFKITQDYSYIFSLHENDLILIEHDEWSGIFRFLSSRSDGSNKVEVKPIYKSKFDKQEEVAIGRKINLLKKYHTDILGNIYRSKDEKLKLKFNL